MRTQKCPLCGHTVTARDTGRTRYNAASDPWDMDEHFVVDTRGGESFRQPCPASGKNEWCAINTG